MQYPTQKHFPYPGLGLTYTLYVVCVYILFAISSGLDKLSLLTSDKGYDNHLDLNSDHVVGNVHLHSYKQSSLVSLYMRIVKFNFCLFQKSILHPWNGNKTFFNAVSVFIIFYLLYRCRPFQWTFLTTKRKEKKMVLIKLKKQDFARMTINLINDIWISCVAVIYYIKYNLFDTRLFAGSISQPS